MASLADVVFYVAVPLASLAVGVAAIGAGQDRDACRRQRGVAKALMTDLRRIGTELQELSHELSSASWTRGPVLRDPTVHQWVEGLIAQVADEAPGVFALYMQLQRSLSELAETRAKCHSALKAVDQAFGHFSNREENRMAVFAAGTQDPETGWQMPRRPDEVMDQLPDDIGELTRIAASNGELRKSALAKIEWTESTIIATVAIDDFHHHLRAAGGVNTSLMRMVEPLAQRSIPTLPTLLLRSTFPEAPEVEAERKLIASRRAKER